MTEKELKAFDEYAYTPLPEPIPITEQSWPDGTLPLVSTSTITYNHELFIKDCIEGILMQKTTFPVRVCIFEDCSTDKTANILREYEEKHPGLIKVFYQPENTWKKPIRKKAKEPYYSTRNEAKYIALCEGDDYWTDPMKLQKQVEFMEESPDYVMCYHSYKKITDGVLDSKLLPKVGKDYSKDELLATPGGIAMATKFYLNVHKFHKNIKSPGGDYPFNAFLGTFGKCKFISTILPSVYRIHSGGVFSSKNNSKKNFARINVKSSVLIYFLKKNDKHSIDVCRAELLKTVDKYIDNLEPQNKWIFFRSLQILLYRYFMGKFFLVKPYLAVFKHKFRLATKGG